MKRGLTGMVRTVSSVGEEAVRAFVPHPLPPNPALTLTPDTQKIIDEALIALGRLDGVTTLLPDPGLFIYSYVRKEAVLSSQIEGTQSSLSDLLLFELQEVPGVPLKDVAEVSNYVAALEHGLRRVRDGFPVSGRLIREIHGTLLASGRGAGHRPGEFRRSQNWVGGTRPGNAIFVPPPPEAIHECMAALDRFLNDEPEPTSALVKAALGHVQFETIHPFLDGNGRVGRLLIALLFCSEGVLLEPLLYLSLHFKQHRQQYYDLLTEVRTTGDWEAWLAFFAEAVRETAGGAVATARATVELFDRDQEALRGLGRAARSATLVHEQLQRRPLATVSALVARTDLSPPTVGKALDLLVHEGIVLEITGRRRNRVFAYDGYLTLLNEGTESV